VALQQLAIVLGILGAFWSNSLILHTELADASKWRWMFAVGAFPAVAFLVLILAVPESPRWLCKQGFTDAAQAVLVRVAGTEAAAQEMAQIREAIAQEGGSFSDLLKPGLRRALGIGVTLAVLTQVTGINAIMYYAPEVFRAAGASRDAAFASSVWVGAVNLAFTLVALALIDRAGRRPLLILGAGVQTMALAAVGWSFLEMRQGPATLAAVLVYIAAFAVAMGPIPWVLISEIFPGAIRGRAVAVGVGTIWAACLIVAQTFPVLKESVGPAATFWIYAGCSLLSLVFVIALVPETKGRSLEAIAESWRRT
jgi:SP family arabinose:H+ symporter-like MFS transporter